MEVIVKPLAYENVKRVEVAPGRQVLIVTPGKARKRKKRFSNKGHRDIYRMDLAALKGTRQLASAAKSGLTQIIEKTEKSAGRRKDGALRDILRNQSSAMRAVNAHLSRAVPDYLDRIADVKLIRRVLRP
jgi:hypothetical protein